MRNQDDDMAVRQETELVRAVQGGDTRAFEPLVDMHLDHLRALIALKLPVAHLVNEIAHESFVFAYRNIHTFTAGTSLRAWLRAIACNLVRAELQRYAREQANQFTYARHRLLEQELHRSDAHDAAEMEFLHTCVDELPPPMKELLTLKYREELPTEQIASRLQRTQTWVWQVLFRLRQQLRQCVESKLAGGQP
ncbi:MAG: sigma-70 family RNA polymerase sigma factor [Verrucomicrobia bacterium]|nr:sigma-70 family RNA polymerase sigma factor [Verrucomicrobiota bacterium]